MVHKITNSIKSLFLSIKWKKTFSVLLGFALLGLITMGAYWLISEVWSEFKLLDREISLALLTAFTTVFVATLTVVLGKNYERNKDIEAHYRQKKTDIYDEFLKEFFRIFYSEKSDDEDIDVDNHLVSFLREWQRKIILWGGQDVVTKYIIWMNKLKQGDADAQTMFLTEQLFIAIRKDLGHNNSNLPKGTFIHFMLRNSELFLLMSKNNSDMKLSELAEVEALLEKDK